MLNKFMRIRVKTIIILSALFLFCSCSDDSGNSGDDGNNGGSNTVNMEALSQGFNLGEGFENAQYATNVNFIAPQGSKLLVASKRGSTYKGTPVGLICRLNADGSLDTSFNTQNSFADVFGDPYYILVLSDGKILVSGNFTANNAQQTKGIALLNNDGSLDNSFNVGGSGLDGNGVYALAEDSQGRIYAGGFFFKFNNVIYNKNLVCFNRNGSVNTAFQMGTGFSAEVQDIEFDTNGKLWVCGRFSKYNEVNTKYLAILNPDGSIDKTFDIFSQNALMTHGINDIAFQSSGKAIVAGAFKCNGKEGIARLNANGTYDDTFEYSDFLSDVWGIWPRSVAVMGGDEIVVGGVFDKSITVLNKEGVRHNGFNVTNSFNGNVYDVYVSPEGYIYAGGNFTEYEGIASGGVARLRGKAN